jgi:hypothetical protein
MPTAVVDKDRLFTARFTSNELYIAETKVINAMCL